MLRFLGLSRFVCVAAVACVGGSCVLRRWGASGRPTRGGGPDAQSLAVGQHSRLPCMGTSGYKAGVWRRVCACAVPPVQSFLFGHSRAEVVYDCR
ncbi:hypothetical protein GCM10022254_28510 [Actinomadura meridiana]|uniref:Secreted protein n=1 Tax=Actinomadura meridiana TaxID=559626 RepID=A0ABP8C1D1_9ACTN